MSQHPMNEQLQPREMPPEHPEKVADGHLGHSEALTPAEALARLHNSRQRVSEWLIDAMGRQEPAGRIQDLQRRLADVQLCIQALREVHPELLTTAPTRISSEPGARQPWPGEGLPR